jgi:hypothetical protein
MRKQLDILVQVNMHYHDHACYADAMEKVEHERDQMIADLVAWSGKTLREVVQFIGDLTFGGEIGLTFDEQLSATHGYAHIQWLHRGAEAR